MSWPAGSWGQAWSPAWGSGATRQAAWLGSRVQLTPPSREETTSTWPLGQAGLSPLAKPTWTAPVRGSTVGTAPWLSTHMSMPGGAGGRPTLSGAWMEGSGDGGATLPRPPAPQRLWLAPSTYTGVLQ